MLNRFIKNLRSESPLCLALIMTIGLFIALGNIAHAALTPSSVDNTKTTSISTGSIGDPVRIAKDKDGKLYVTVPKAGKVLVYSQDGALYNTISGINSPLSIAVDGLGRIYVGDSSNGSVTALDPSGRYIFTLGMGSGEFGFPSDIAVASNGQIYITDSVNNRVVYYNDNGSKAGFFGAYGLGAGQMNFPTGIAIDDVNSEVYVVNHFNFRVDIFDLAGNYKRSFGGSSCSVGGLTTTSSANPGQCAGSAPFDRPQGIAVAEGYVYIVDSLKAIVRVYDTSGALQFDIGLGDLSVPLDVLKAGAKLYVTSSDNRKVVVYDVRDNLGLSIAPASISFSANIDTNPAGQSVQINPQVTGQSVVVSTVTTVGALSGRITVSGFAGAAPSAATVDVNTAGLSEGDYSGMVVFHVQGGSDYVLNVYLNIQKKYQITANPASVSMAYSKDLATTISIASGNGVLSWTSAKVNADWLDVPSSGTTMSKNVVLSLNANADRLSEGVYSGSIIFNASESVNKSVTVPVTLTVKKIYALPGNINLTYKIGGGLGSDTISVYSGGADMQWTASANVDWLDLTSLSGTTPGNIGVKLNSKAASLPVGVYSGVVTLSATDAANQQVAVGVALRVISAGKVVVSTNIDQASFGITGPVVRVGGGKVWEGDELAPGSYTIVFNNVQGFRKPVSQNFVISSGSTQQISVQYRQIPMANVIAAAKGPGMSNDATVKILDFNGNVINEIKAFNARYGANVAMGDVEGLGSDSIIVGTGAGKENNAEVKVYRYNGALLSSIPAFAGTQYGANVASGDVNGDGKYAVAVSMFDGNSNSPVVAIYTLDNNNVMQPKSWPLFSDGSKYPPSIAFGDVNGDGRLELIVVGTYKVNVYAFDSALNWTLVSSITRNDPSATLSDQNRDTPMKVTAGDINGDGVDEVIVGDVLGSGLSHTGDVMPNIFSAGAFGNGNSSMTLSCMDWNGDGRMEILAGQGANHDNRAVFRIYDSDGNMFKEINAFRASRYGVNAAFGAIK